MYASLTVKASTIMSQVYTRRVSTLINAIVKHIPKNTKKASRSISEEFVRQYYAYSPLADLEQMDPKEACKILGISSDFDCTLL